MSKKNKKFTKVLTVRISPDQHARLLETIISEYRNGRSNSLNPAEKSKIIREMIDKYTTRLS